MTRYARSMRTTLTLADDVAAAIERAPARALDRDQRSRQRAYPRRPGQTGPTSAPVSSTVPRSGPAGSTSTTSPTRWRPSRARPAADAARRQLAALRRPRASRAAQASRLTWLTEQLNGSQSGSDSLGRASTPSCESRPIPGHFNGPSIPAPHGHASPTGSPRPSPGCPSRALSIPASSASLIHAHHVRGNLIPDAALAALAIEHGVTLASTDTDFARFRGLRWEDPLA